MSSPSTACFPRISALWMNNGTAVKVLENQTSSFAQYAFLRDLQDTNETLFYSLIVDLPKNYCPSSTRRPWAKDASVSAKSGASRVVFL